MRPVILFLQAVVLLLFLQSPTHSNNSRLLTLILTTHHHHNSKEAKLPQPPTPIPTPPTLILRTLINNKEDNHRKDYSNLNTKLILNTPSTHNNNNNLNILSTLLSRNKSVGGRKKKVDGEKKNTNIFNAGNVVYIQWEEKSSKTKKTNIFFFLQN